MRTLKHTQNNMKARSFKTQRGFTLIEIAITSFILGIIIAAALVPYNIYRQTQIRETTSNNIIKINTAIDNFLFQNGRYPCPARLDASRTDPDYGLETDCENDGGPGDEYPIFTIGQCTGGLCFERSERTVDLDPSDAGVNILDPVIIRRGAVPFRALQLTEDEALDGFGMRVQYALTEHLAVRETFFRTTGGISIVDSQGNSRVNPPQSGQYFLFSTGEDKNGAYTIEGVQVFGCDASRLDGENCDTTTDNLAIYAAGDFNNSGTASHFDDTAQYYSTAENPLWRVTGNGFDIRDVPEVENSDAVIGVGTDTPDQTVEMDVSGEVRGVETDNKIQTNAICDDETGSSNCFSPGDFGAETPVDSFNCDTTDNPGQLATGFSNGSIDCTGVREVRCPAGHFLTGINPDGTLDCTAVTGCPSQNVDLCTIAGVTDVFNLPASLPGRRVTTDVSGASRRETWQCQNDGTWTRVNRRGVCTCTPVDETDDLSCEAVREGFWNGTVTVRDQTICPQGQSTRTILEENCTCREDSIVEPNLRCNPGRLSGSRTRTTQWVCDSPDSGRFLNPVTTDNCFCDSNRRQPRNRDCPPGFDGDGIDQERRLICPDAVWGPWQEVSRDCTCNDGEQEFRTRGCDAPETGTITEVRKFNCSTGSFGPWTESSRRCGQATLQWRTKTNSTGPFANSLSNKAGRICTQAGARERCSSATGNGQHFHFDVCECE